MNQCDKHDITMERLFDEIHAIKEGQGRSETKMDTVIDFKNEIHKIIYGDGKVPGLMSKIHGNTKQLILQWGLIVVILIAIIGGSFYNG